MGEFTIAFFMFFIVQIIYFMLSISLSRLVHPHCTKFKKHKTKNNFVHMPQTFYMSKPYNKQRPNNIYKPRKNYGRNSWR